jgi:hypothetical protein
MANPMEALAGLKAKIALKKKGKQANPFAKKTNGSTAAPASPRGQGKGFPVEPDADDMKAKSGKC